MHKVLRWLFQPPGTDVFPREVLLGPAKASGGPCVMQYDQCLGEPYLVKIMHETVHEL